MSRLALIKVAFLGLLACVAAQGVMTKSYGAITCPAGSAAATGTIGTTCVLAANCGGFKPQDNNDQPIAYGSCKLSSSCSGSSATVSFYPASDTTCSTTGSSVITINLDASGTCKDKSNNQYSGTCNSNNLVLSTWKPVCNGAGTTVGPTIAPGCVNCANIGYGPLGCIGAQGYKVTSCSATTATLNTYTDTACTSAATALSPKAIGQCGVENGVAVMTMCSGTSMVSVAGGLVALLMTLAATMLF